MSHVFFSFLNVKKRGEGKLFTFIQKGLFMSCMEGVVASSIKFIDFH